VYTFDGPNRLIIMDSGTTTYDCKDVYSRWKDWVKTSDNAKYAQALDVLGGNPIDPVEGTTIPFFLFLINGWYCRPQEASHTLKVTNGILIGDGGAEPFLDTLGAYTVKINYQQPVQAIGVSTAYVTAIVAALFTQDMSAVTGENPRSLLNAIRKLMNKVALNDLGDTLTVYKEDDATPAYMQSVVTDQNQKPIKSVDTV